jgi:probable HAF family extracellular repeat protein
MRILRGRTLLGAITLSVGAALCATPAATAAGPATAASGYRIVDLGTLGGGGHSDAIAINERGHIAGTSNGRAVLWRNGHIIDLGVLPGARDSYPLDLNDRDEVVGSSTIVLSQGEEPETTVHAFVWRNGRMRDLGALPGGDYSVATGINERGDIVGRSTHQTGPWGSYYSHAVLWRNGGIVELESDEVLSYAEDITNDGWIVGSRGTPADPETYTEAVAWKDGRATVLYPGDAVAANERHQAIGSHLSVGSSVLWTRGVVTDVGRPPGDAFVMAADINNRGQVVGWAESGAFVWHQGTAPTVLPDLGGSGGASAAGINDRGQIVGGASLSDIEAHAVLWTR